MADEGLVVFVEEATTYRIDGGMVHAEDRSGRGVYRRVMSITTFVESLALAQEALAKWRWEQIERGEPGPAIPFRRKRK